MALALVKRCPGCGSEHVAHTLRCGCGVLLAGVDLSEPASPAAGGIDAPPPPAETEAAGLVCAHPDCGQHSPAGSTRCLYCDRLFDQDLPEVRITWPWGESERMTAELLVGRVAPAPPALIERLEQQYSNVSRRHALLRLEEGRLSIEDLGSANGTFVNEVRLPAHQPIRLHGGARIRFAADLLGIVDVQGASHAGQA